MSTEPDCFAKPQLLARSADLPYRAISKARVSRTTVTLT